MGLATWNPISENWDDSIERLLFHSSHIHWIIHNVSLWWINLLEISRLP